MANFLYFFKRDANSNDIPIAVDNTSPLTTSVWNFILPQPDGIFVAIIFGFNLWSAGTYTLNNCVYYSGSYYKCAVASTTSTPGSDANWTLITNILSTVVGLANSNVTYNNAYAFSAARAASGPIGDSLSQIGVDIKDGRCKNWQQASSVLLGGALINSAWSNFQRGDYVNAQQIMDYLDAQTDDTL